uniref:Glutathione synthetase n=1 Tax=Romanomermis culicivorax TaxID=13658 RepID=A0A915K552_ROMCU
MQEIVFCQVRVTNLGRLAENRAIENVAKAIVGAWRCYNNRDAAIVFVVEGVDLNAMDQRLTEYTINDLEDRIQIYRLTLKQCYYRLRLDNNMKLKFKDHEMEVAVVYFRSGYSPNQYPTEDEWQARRIIEKSTAIKCPWIGAQLAGSKKIQQVLTNYRELIKFQSDRTCRNMMDTFAKIYSLDSDNVNRESLLNNVRKNPHGYVLKPQREGGGNNLFGQAASDFLESVPEIDLESYILMERLKPMVHENILVRANQPLYLDEMDSELGTFGYVLGTKDSVLDQDQYGHLFRTKPAADNEGGTIKGTAGHDAPFLIF